MRYGSVCSGVEAASLAWMPLGWECVFVSEVEPFPCAVLQERFGATAPIHPLDPEEAADEKDRKMRISWMKQNAKLKKEGKIPNEGDFTKIGKKYAGKIDLLVGGTPCQDLSVAGKREGFNGKRSSLAIDFVRLAYESQCKWFVWENVPGVFSSNGGGDFATLLSLFTGCEVGVPEQGFGNAGFVCNARRDRYGVAWRVLDSQFTRVSRFPFAIPQRRRRVFVVGYFGDWTKAAEVCLEPDRLSWNTPARIKTREIFAGNAGTDAGMAGGEFQIDNGKGRRTDVCNTLYCKCKDGAIRNGIGCVAVETGEFRSSQHGKFVKTDTAGTIKQNSASCGNSSSTLKVEYAAGFMGGQGAKAGGIGFDENVSPTVKSSQSGGNQVPDVICCHGSQDPITNTEHANAVNRNMGQYGFDGYNQKATGDVCKSLSNAATDSDHVPLVYSIGNGQTNSLQTENELAQTLNTMHDQQAIVIRKRGGKPGGGKGPLISKESSLTLGCNNDQILFEKNGVSQYGEVAGTLEARHDSSPCPDRGQNIVCMNPHDPQSIRVYGENGVWPNLNANENGGQNRASVLCYDARENGDGQTVNTITGDHGNRITDYTQIVQECYQINGMVIGKEAKDGDRQTTGIGNDNDPSPTIGAGQHHAVAITEKVYSLSAISSKGMKSKTPAGYCHELDSARTLDTTSNDPNKNMGGMAILSSVDKQGIMGINTINQKETNYADAKKTRPCEILFLLRETIGESAFRQWAVGGYGSFQKEKVLRPELYGTGVRCKAGEEKSRMDDSPLSCEKNCPARSLRDLWGEVCTGCSPQGRSSGKQFSGESDKDLPELSQQDSSSEKTLCDMWETAEGAWLLQQALTTLQEIRKSASVQEKSIRYDSYSLVRRLTPIETERLMGFPDNHTRTAYNGKPEEECPDSPRYKSCGNSMCVNCMEWIGRQIERVSSHKLQVTREEDEKHD